MKLHDAYLSVHEALKHAGVHAGCRVHVRWVDAENMSYEEAVHELEQVDGVLVPGGFGSRGWEGKILACRVAREEEIPYLGICLGMHVAVSEFARHVCGMDGANSTEMDPETPFPVIDLLPEQKEIEDLGGTMRLGAQAVELEEGTRARDTYGEPVVHERHRHRYEVNNELRQRLVDGGLVVSGTFQDGRLVEIVELPDHPWFVASQFHPEFKSRPTRPAPLFREFVVAALERARSRSSARRRQLTGSLAVTAAVTVPAAVALPRKGYMLRARTWGHGSSVTVATETDTPASRARFLRLTAAGAGTLTLGAVLAAGVPRLGHSGTAQARDVEILNYALLLEELQAAFYARGASTAARSQGELARVRRGRGRSRARARRDHPEGARRERAQAVPRFAFGNACHEPEAVRQDGARPRGARRRRLQRAGDQRLEAGAASGRGHRVGRRAPCRVDPGDPGHAAREPGRPTWRRRGSRCSSRSTARDS